MNFSIYLFLQNQVTPNDTIVRYSEISTGNLISKLTIQRSNCKHTITVSHGFNNHGLRNPNPKPNPSPDSKGVMAKFAKRGRSGCQRLSFTLRTSLTRLLLAYCSPWRRIWICRFICSSLPYSWHQLNSHISRSRGCVASISHGTGRFWGVAGRGQTPHVDHDRPSSSSRQVYQPAASFVFFVSFAMYGLVLKVRYCGLELEVLRFGGIRSC